MTCTACQHFVRLNADGGLCRRHAPHATVVGRFRPEFGANIPAWPNESATLWPPVQDKDYCGDYQARPETPNLGAPDREG